MADQSLTAVVTDKRQIEMRYFDVPALSADDAILRSSCAASAAATTITISRCITGPIKRRRRSWATTWSAELPMFQHGGQTLAG